MTKEMIISSNGHETIVAILEDDLVAEIFVERERAYQEDYRRIPSLDELCSRYGDMTSRKVYAMSRDVEGRWLDLHERETGTKRPID